MYIERGINYRHQSVFKNKFQWNCRSQKTEFQQLNIKQLEIGFVLLIVGSLVSVFSLIHQLIKCRLCTEYSKPQKIQNQLSFITNNILKNYDLKAMVHWFNKGNQYLRTPPLTIFKNNVINLSSSPFEKQDSIK